MKARWKATWTAVFAAGLIWAIWHAVVGWVALDPVGGLGPETRQWVIRSLRAAANRERPPARPAGAAWWDLSRRFPGPVFVQLYLRGRVIFTYQSAPRIPLEQAVSEACKRLGRDPEIGRLSKKELRDSRFKVDLTTARGPILTRPKVLLALSVVPGLDGIGIETSHGRTGYITPDELLRRNLMTGYRPFKFVAEFKAGLHIDAVSNILARRLGLDPPRSGHLPPGRLFRFRTFGFVEGISLPEGREPLLVDGGISGKSGSDANTGATKPPETGRRTGVPPSHEATHHVLEGTQTPPMTEGKRRPPLVVIRGTTVPPPRLSRRNVLKACIRAGRYILRMLSRGRDQVTVRLVRESNGTVHHLTEFELMPGARIFERKSRLERGQFRYIYYPLTDNYLVGGYSLPRHAGTTYILALLAGRLKKEPLVSPRQVEEFRRGAALAIGYLADRVRRGRCQGPDYRCVALGRYTDLGSTALPVVAVMEYIRQTGDRRFESLGRQMANFLLFMQQPSGEFCHIFDVVKKRRDCKTKLLYYSGEAALALAMAYKVLGDKAYLDAAKSALDYQTGPYISPLTMKFLYGEDHWTAIAANEIWPHAKKAAYARFAYGFAVYQQRQQFVPNETFDDYVGGYGITPFFPPHLTPAGSRTEAAVAAYKLSLARGEPRYDILNQIRLAFSYIIRHQVRLDNAYMFVDPWKADGAIRKSPVKYDVRIDYIQHTVSAMLNGLDFVPK